METVDRAESYIARVPLPAEGGRNDALNKLAFAVMERFTLEDADFERLLTDWGTQAGLSEAECLKTIRSARRAATGKGVAGSKARPHSQGTSTPRPAVQRPATAKPAIKPLNVDDDSIVLPKPMPDGARALLKSVFKEGEGVRIAQARLDADGEVPADAGRVLSREEWLRKLDEFNGDPNAAIHWSSSKTGIYISVNPMREGRGRDEDVTDYRHCLLEFDNISTVQQFRLYSLSKVPCAAIIASGGKSIHAWVKVDAQNIREYHERAKFLYDFFGAHQPDSKNRNPSRFSRLPNCIRLGKRQELLHLDMGATSWSEWVTGIETDGIGRVIKPEDLLGFKTDDDANSLLGNRWICKGHGALLIGPSGIGKSSLVMQMIVCWALNRPAFGIRPARALRALVIQAENDLGDLSEQFRGVLAGMGISEFEHDADLAVLNERLTFVEEAVQSGDSFVEACQKLVSRHRPDLVVIDPAAAFVGDDISRQLVVAKFFRNGLNPIAKANGCAFLIVNHTTKPSQDPKSKSGWRSSDQQYAGAGSYDLPGWARAVMTLRQVDEWKFELILSKRGKRAGATLISGEPATSLWLQHATEGIHWEQVEPPTFQQPKEGRAGAPSKIEKVMGLGLGPVIDRLTKPVSQNKLAELIEDFAAEKRTDIKLSTAKKVVEKLVENGAIKKTKEGYIKA